MDYRIERFTLGNGLRVVLCPDRSAPVIGVAVVFDVGIRSEPEGRTGFAHLFEHLMFQGSANLEKLAHFRYVQGAGGSFNGSTHLDYTDYFESAPSNALERMLFLEADRMRGIRLNEDNLRNQIDVVKEEIRVNVLNRPYGGFPWLKLPPVMFGTFPNAHDGYGSFTDLEAATAADAAEFFDRYYACGNAALSVSGDFDPDAARTLIEKHFGDVPARPAPPRPALTEPDLTEERYESYVDRLAPVLAFASAWRVPDPIDDFAGYLPYLLLAELLTASDAARLVQRLVLQDRAATSVTAQVGFMGDHLEVRDPTALQVRVHLPAEGEVHKALATMDEEFDRLAQDGMTAAELRRAKARMIATFVRETDPVVDRAQRLAVFELQRAHPALLNELPLLIADVTGDQLRAAAARLLPGRRASIEVIPGATS